MSVLVAAEAGRLASSRRGTVAAFSGERGTGLVEDEGGGCWPFHCVELADGSRTVPVGAPVVFTVRAGVAGTLEATRLVRV